MQRLITLWQNATPAVQIALVVGVVVVVLGLVWLGVQADLIGRWLAGN